MKIKATFTAIFFLCNMLFANDIIDNVTFTDMQGKTYDLYEILESGKHIYAHCSFYN